MDGARGLPPAEQPQQERQRASMVGDMVRPVSTISGPETKITEEIGQLLQRVVVPRLLALGEVQARMVDDLVRQLRQVARVGSRSREMAAREGVAREEQRR